MLHMKKVMYFMTALAICFVGTACGNTQPAQQTNTTQETVVAAQEQPAATVPETQTEAETEVNTTTAEETTTQTISQGSENNVLVIYFSASNTKDADAVSSATPMVGDDSATDWFAGLIADRFDADIMKVVPSVDYPLDYDSLADAAKTEADTDARPVFEKLDVDPSSYQTVFIGYPIWWYKLPMVMESFFDSYDFTGVTIIPFNTHAGSWDGGTYDMIRDREPGATVLEGRPLTGDKAGSEEAVEVITEWMDALQIG